MIYELRTYQLAFGGLPEYLEVAKTLSSRLDSGTPRLASSTRSATCGPTGT